MTRALRPVPDAPPRAVLYLRQSEYREESVSFELQETAGREYCARQGYEIVAVEADRSTGKLWKNRPAVQRAMGMIETGDADIIVLWKWSRLSRNRTHWAIAADTVAVAGGRIESSTEPIDTTTASGRFARGVMTEYAAFQSEQIGETWEEVRQRRLRLGLPVSGRLPWGWEWANGGIRAVPDRAEIVHEMFRRYLAGDGSAAIARWLNARGVPAPNGGTWERMRPFSVMDSPIHAGLIPYRGVEHPGAHDGIIDEATWAEYKAMRAARRAGREYTRQSQYLLSGLIRCGTLVDGQPCGRRMNGKGAVTGGIWYSGYLCTSMHPEHGRSYISSKRIDPLVHEWISGLADEISSEIVDVGRIDNEALSQRLEAEWNAEQRRIDDLTPLLLDDVISRTSDTATRRKVELRQAEIGRLLDEARSQLKRIPDVGSEELRSLAEDWPDLPDDMRHRMLLALLDDVVVRPGESATFRSRWGETTTILLR